SVGNISPPQEVANAPMKSCGSPRMCSMITLFLSRPSEGIRQPATGSGFGRKSPDLSAGTRGTDAANEGVGSGDLLANPATTGQDCRRGPSSAPWPPHAQVGEN